MEGAGNLTPAHFGRSAELQVGEIVLAMGNPFGLDSSVTHGLVSGLGRTVREPASESSPGAVLRQAIQTSAEINPGNSGGALRPASASSTSRPAGQPTLPACGVAT